MRHRDSTNTNSAPTNTRAQGVDEWKKRCRYTDQHGGCKSDWTRTMNYGEGKAMGFCDNHWDARETQRPATREYFAATLEKVEQLLAGTHTLAVKCRHCGEVWPAAKRCGSCGDTDLEPVTVSGKAGRA